MKKLGLNGKILWPAAALTFLLLALTVLFTAIQFIGFSETMMQYRLEMAASGARNISEEKRLTALDLAHRTAADPAVAAAFRDGDREELLRILVPLAEENVVSAYFAAIGADGLVLVRSHQPERYGFEPVAGNVMLQEALQGRAFYRFGGGGMPATIRSSVPVFYDGEIVGMLVAAFSMDGPKTVDYLSERFGAEISVFVDGYSTGSTLFTEDGERAVGTRLADRIFDTVFEQGEEYMGPVVIFGRPLSAFYTPLKTPEGSIYAAMFLGIDNSDIVSARRATIFVVIAMAVTGFLALLAILFVIIKKLIRPIKGLETVVNSVADGNFSINMDRHDILGDEIGRLTVDVYSFVDIVKGLVHDMEQVAKEHERGDIDVFVDVDKYRGGYKEMAIQINSMVANYVNIIRETLGGVGKIAKGDFEATIPQYPLKKAFINESFDTLKENIKNVDEGIRGMIDAAAVKGDMLYSIDESTFAGYGSWLDIVKGLNQVCVAVDTPIVEIRDVVARLNAGHFDKYVEGSYAGDFLAIKNDVNQLVENLGKYIHEIDACLKAIADGDLTRRSKIEFGGDFKRIGESISNITDALHRTISEIYAASDNLLIGSQQIANTAQDLAGTVLMQASSVEELSASVDMVSEQTKQNADSALEASQLSGTSATSAKESNDAMSHMLEAMLKIKESSGNISAIINDIQDIAFQTNLLSLNASIEAARAGEHGRSFSVVADEVRNLANRSQQSAVETTGIIKDSIVRVDTGSDIANSTAKSLIAVLENVEAVLEIINSISDASKNQAEAIEQIGLSLTQISQTIQSNSAVSQETAAASEELTSQAELLRRLIQYFKL